MWAGSYHQLGAELCARAGVAWNEPPNDLSEATRLFWNETSGVLLLEAAAKLGEKWDALVVDETQERSEDELPEHDGDRRVPGPADGRAGGGAAARVALGGAGRGAEGRPLEGRGGGTREGGRAARSSSRRRGSGWGGWRSSGCGGSRSRASPGGPSWPASPWPRSATTAARPSAAGSAFSGATGMGLEADVVLLLDVNGSEWAMKPRNLYVAASRARLRLHVFARNGVEVPGRAWATL